MTSPAVSSALRRQLFTSASNDRESWRTPLGWAVVPEVNRINAHASALANPGCGGGDCSDTEPRTGKGIQPLTRCATLSRLSGLPPAAARALSISAVGTRLLEPGPAMTADGRVCCRHGA